MQLCNGGVFEYFYFRKNIIRQYSEFDFSIFHQGKHIAEGDIQIRFDKTIFDSDIVFSGTIFHGDVSFELCELNVPAKFSHPFEDNWYAKKLESSHVDIRRLAYFKGDVKFTRAYSGRGLIFDHVKFDIPPDCTDTDFHEPLVLDADRIDETASLALGRAEWLKLRLDERYRLLRQYAERRKDRKNELEFRARELRAWRRRFRIEWANRLHPLVEAAQACWHHFRKHGRAGCASCLEELRYAWRHFRNAREEANYPGAIGVYVISLLYGGLSNYGRSFMRPIIGWFISLLVFALLYYQKSGWIAWKESALLSLRQGFVVSGFTKTAYYDNLLRKVFMAQEKGPHMPLDLGWGYLLLMSQTAVSFLFLFLFALAIRNHLRMR